jgi:hypothetical protein
VTTGAHKKTSHFTGPRQCRFASRVRKFIRMEAFNVFLGNNLLFTVDRLRRSLVNGSGNEAIASVNVSLCDF